MKAQFQQARRKVRLQLTRTDYVDNNATRKQFCDIYTLYIYKLTPLPGQRVRPMAAVRRRDEAERATRCYKTLAPLLPLE